MKSCPSDAARQTRPNSLIMNEVQFEAGAPKSTADRDFATYYDSHIATTVTVILSAGQPHSRVLRLYCPRRLNDQMESNCEQTDLEVAGACEALVDARRQTLDAAVDANMARRLQSGRKADRLEDADRNDKPLHVHISAPSSNVAEDDHQGACVSCDQGGIQQTTDGIRGELQLELYKCAGGHPYCHDFECQQMIRGTTLERVLVDEVCIRQL